MSNPARLPHIGNGTAARCRVLDSPRSRTCRPNADSPNVSIESIVLKKAALSGVVSAAG